MNALLCRRQPSLPALRIWDVQPLHYCTSPKPTAREGPPMGDRRRDSTAHVQRAAKLIDEGSFEEAVNILSRAVFADPSNADLFRVPRGRTLTG